MQKRQNKIKKKNRIFGGPAKHRGEKKGKGEKGKGGCETGAGWGREHEKKEKRRRAGLNGKKKNLFGSRIFPTQRSGKREGNEQKKKKGSPKGCEP